MDAGIWTLLSYGVAALAVGGSIYVMYKVERYDWANWRAKKKQEEPSPSSERTGQ